MIFGIVYLRTRENMAMIDKGMNPKQYANSPAPFRSLKFGLLLVGAGLGLLVAYLIDVSMSSNLPFHERHNPAIYFALISLGGGLGLVGSYFMEKKEWDKTKEIQP